MATIRLVNNILENKEKVFTVEEGVSIEQIIRDFSDEKVFEGATVECYDAKTGKTYYTPLEDSDSITAAVIVNGKDESLSYKVKKDDVIHIFITPSGSGWENFWEGFRNGWNWGWSGLQDALGIDWESQWWNPGSWLVAVVGMAWGLLSGICGGFKNIGKEDEPETGTSESAEKGSELPDVRGASNQPLTGNPIPLVVGKHLCAPMIVGSTWNEFLGTHGEETYIHAMYAVGYAPLRITDMKLGEVFVAHNQSWKQSPSMKNIFHGKLSGIDEGMYEDIDPELQSHTTIDLAHRPQIDAATMRAAGWTEVEDGEIATVYSSAYSNEPTNNKCVLVTPILSNGTVLSPSQLEEYANTLLSGGTVPYDILLHEIFTGSNCIEESNVYAERLHKNQEGYYLGEYTGDIPNYWRKNDISIEILQQDQNGGDIDYGTIYPYAKIQKEVNAACLYVIDKDAGDTVSYKGVSVSNGLRNNRIEPTEQFPKSVSVELTFKNGLYRQRNQKSGDNSIVVYQKIPCYFAIQWRPYSDENILYEGDESGEETLPTWDSVNKRYSTHKRGWTSFESFNDDILPVVYDKNARKHDKDYHTGQSLPDNFNKDWLMATVFNAESLGADDKKSKGLNQFRCFTEIDLWGWATRNLFTNGDSQATKIAKFKDYFYNVSNTANCIEVRVVRVSPSYINETSSGKDNGPWNYNDVFSWVTITAEMYDGTKLMNENQLVQKRVLPDNYMRKMCLIAIKAKADTSENIESTLKKFSVVAQSFSPYFDDTTKKWVPENVLKINRYEDPNGNLITKAQYEQDRQNGIKSVCRPDGNDFVKNLVTDVIRVSANIDDKGRFYIPDTLLKYCENNVASMYIYAGIGPHLGVDALGYTQSNFYTHGIGDFNLLALSKWYKWAEDVVDGSTYGSEGYHYDKNGNPVHHNKGETVHIRFSANAYIYKPETLEALLSKISIAGRSIYTRDEKNRLTIVIDKPENYPVALINQKNIIKASYSISFGELPSGLLLAFNDENDGYVQNNLYCMVDENEDVNDPKKAIEDYSVQMVTNPQQAWSLGRYILANRVLNREVVNVTVGIEGISIALGNLIVLQSDTMLIGTDNGGRITQLLEDDNLIYGFIIDNTFHYTGEVEEYQNSSNQTLYRSKQGVLVMQPSQYKESKVITLRLALPETTRIINDVEYKQEVGHTNLVLLDSPISKNDNVEDNGVVYVYKPKVENIVGFGYVGNTSALYRVIKIKADNKRNYELTLNKYQEDLYRYGAELPSFQNNMTLPDRSKEDSFNFSETITQSQLTEQISESSKFISNIVEKNIAKAPGTPVNLKAAVYKDFIRLTCADSSTDNNLLSAIIYEITLYRKYNNTVQSKTITVEGTFTHDYYFNREWEGYPEAYEEDVGLANWSFRAKAKGSFLDEEGNRLESSWTSSVSCSVESLSLYGTWKPQIPVILKKDAGENGIDFQWKAATGGSQRELYGTNTYTLTVLYRIQENQTPIQRSVIQTPSLAASYAFDRELDGYPEIANASVTLDKFLYKIKVTNQSGNEVESQLLNDIDTTNYLGWKPNIPVVQTRSSGRTVTLNPVNAEQRYGKIRYDYLVRNVEKDGNTYYLPTPTADFTASENNYRDTTQADVPFRADSPYTQTMPLKGQNNTGYRYLSWTGTDYNSGENKQLTYVLLDPAPSSATTQTMYIGNEQVAAKVWTTDGVKHASVATLMPSPVDTEYRFKVRAVNVIADNVASDYVEDILTTAKATSAYDVVKAGITATQLAPNAVTAEAIAAGSISAEKIFVESLAAITANLGHITDGNLTTDENNYWYLSDEYSLGQLIKKAGSFRVGGQNQYLSVTPDPNHEGDYIIELKAGNITLTSGSDAAFESGTFIFDKSDRTKRLALTSNGIVAQKYQNNDWVNLAKLTIDGTGNLVLTNSDTMPPMGYQIPNADIYHFDTSTNLAESGTNVQSITASGSLKDLADTEPILVYPDSTKCLNGTVTKDISSYTGRVAFLTKSNLITVGNKSFYTDGTAYTGTAGEYNTALKQTSRYDASKTAGAYLGLTSSQVTNGVFKNIE